MMVVAKPMTVGAKPSPVYMRRIDSVSICNTNVRRQFHQHTSRVRTSLRADGCGRAQPGPPLAAALQRPHLLLGERVPECCMVKGGVREGEVRRGEEES